MDEPLETPPAAGAAGPVLSRRFDWCWSSPALCAKQTAAVFSFESIVDPQLRDCDYGRWAGRRLRDLEAEEPDAVKAWLSDINRAPHGGESIAQLLQRIARWLDQRIGDGGHSVAVTHSAVIRGAILHAIGAPAQSFWLIDVGPLSVTQLSSDGSRWRWSALRAGELQSE